HRGPTRPAVRPNRRRARARGRGEMARDRLQRDFGLAGSGCPSGILGWRAAKRVFRLHVSTGGRFRMLPARPTNSPELIATVVRAYDLPLAGEGIDLGGSSNLNLLLLGSDRRHVARVYRAWVTPQRLEGIQSVRATLRAAGLFFLPTRPAADG